jgi:aldose sugar dehydrogenase
VEHTKNCPGSIQHRSGGRTARLSGLLLVPVLLLMSACNGNDNAAVETPAVSPTPRGSEEETRQTEEREISLEAAPVATGLEIPWELVFLPDGDMLFTERPGRVRLIEGGQLRDEPVLTVPDVVHDGEGGLLGMALHPEYEENGYIYLYYTTGQDNRVVRYRYQDGAMEPDSVILEGIPRASTHNGGRITFGPDGHLYIATGDAAEPSLSQDRDSLAGKILRIEDDGAVPEDNPFEGSPVFAWGLRNPQGLTWHPDTGDLYITVHGPVANDEINRIEAGANYGWPVTQGDPTRGNNEFVGPVLTSGDHTWAPSGATFVSAEALEPWRGHLIFSGLRSETLWRLVLPDDADGEPILETVLAGEYGRLRQVVEGPDGSLYVLTNNRDGRGSPGDNDDQILRLTAR